MAVGAQQSVRRSTTAARGSWSTEVSLGTGSANDIIWSGTQFVLVADTGVIKTSPDAITWATMVTPTLSNLRQVFFSGTEYVAVGDNSTVLVSTNSVLWSVANLPSASDLSAVAWDGSTYVAVGSGGKIYSSANAVNWTQRLSAAGTSFRDVFSTGQMFVAVGDSGVVYTSGLGLVWTQQFTPVGTLDLHSVDWDGTKFIAVGGNGQIVTSANSLTWNIVAQLNSAGSFFDLLVLPVAVTTGKYFVAGDGGIVDSSSDRVNWVQRQPEVSVAGAARFDDLVFNGSQFLAVGAAAPVVSSPDGIVWSQSSTNSYASVFWDGSRYIGVGNGSSSGTSVDGMNWTAHNLPGSYSLQKVAPGHNTVLVAVSSLGDILTSVDGMNWVVRTSPTSSVLLGIAASATTTIIVGANGTLLASNDLSNWTQQSAPGLGVKKLTDIVFGNNQFVAVGTAGLIFTSADGSSWTNRSLSSVHNFTAITWDGNQYLAVGTQGDILTSLDAITWTVRTSGTVNDLAAISSNSTKAVAVGRFGTILLSQSVNQAPAPTASALVTNEDSVGTVQVAANDPDLGDTQSYAVTAGPADGSATINATGLVSYTPNANFNGSDLLTVTVTDRAGLTGMVNIGITITAVNDPPAPTASTLSIVENMSGTVQIVANDPDVGDSFTYAIATAANHGVASIDSSGLAGYTPNANFNGTDSFVVAVTDSGGLTAPVTVNINIGPINSPPVITIVAITVNGASVDVQLRVTDPDAGDTYTLSISMLPQHGTVSISTSEQVKYTADSGFVGDDALTIMVTDGAGATAQASAGFTISKNSVAVGDAKANTGGARGGSTDFVFLLLLLLGLLRKAPYIRQIQSLLFWMDPHH